MKKRLLSILLCLTMVTGLLPTAFAAEKDTETEFPYTYNTKNDQTAEKVSHPQVAPNSKDEGSRRNDGIVDYIGNGQIANNVGYGDDSGCRGQSYSWSAMAYGDWIYTGLNYNALGQTVQLMDVGLGHKYDPELLPGILNVLYNGDFFTAERDNSANVPGGALVKINTKTGEVKILMSKTAGKYSVKDNVSFRNAVKYNGKFYFCGSVDHAPQIWQVDPKTDDCKKVYGMTAKDFGEGFKDGISAGIRGMCVYKDELIVSCVTKNAKGKFEAQIYSTKTPDDPKSFTVIATQDDLFNYPAFHFSDSIYGGSIWEIVEFNNKLYVSICTGTPDNMPDKNTMQSFAIVRGEKQDNGEWTWTPVVGDKNDGAKYTFGIDPERTCSGAGVLMVYKDHLYIGEYNDEEIALMQVMFNLDFGFMNENLKQSVNLYRMDKNEEIELVVGDKTDMFPEGGSSGSGSGFGHNENQYIWRMTVHNDKLYCGTFDTSSLLEPVGQFSNGDLALWEPVQWNRLFNYIRVLLKLTQDKFGVMPIEQMSKEEQTREDIRYLFDEIDAFALDQDDPEANGSIDAESDLLAELFSDLPDTCFADDSDEAENAITETLEDTFSDSAETYARGDNVRDDMGVFPEFGSNNNEQDDMQVTPNLDQLNQMKKLAKSMQELIQLTKKVIVTAQYMAKADRGCDVYATADGETFETITTDGFGDPFNHGLRVFAETDNGLGFGTANPFYGTQWWLIREDNTKPVEKAPKAPEATEIPTSYIARCVTDKSGHESKMMKLLPDTFAIGEVKKDGNSYICPITISTKAYAEAYSKEVGKEHSAVKERITFNMTWNDNGKEWEAPMTQLPTIDVKCTTSTSGGGSSGGGGGHSSSSSYSITVKESSNGAVTSSHKSAKSGTTITLTAAPEKNYVLDTLKAVDRNNKEITLTAKDGKYTFSMPSSNVTVTATFKKNFTDVPNGSYFEEAVDWAVKKGITTGTGAALFNPDGICTRAQAVTFLWRAAGSPAPQSSAMPFTDVPAGSYYYDAVLWAVENNITKGTSATTFHPDMNCSRAQIVTFLWRSQKSPSADSANPFADVASSAYYADAVLWAVKEDVTKGTSATKFSPDANCTRAQIVTFIWRALSE